MILSLNMTHDDHIIFKKHDFYTTLCEEVIRIASCRGPVEFLRLVLLLQIKTTMSSIILNMHEILNSTHLIEIRVIAHHPVVLPPDRDPCHSAPPGRPT